MPESERFTAADGNTFLLRFEDRPAYLYAHVSGELDSLEVSLAYWQRILARCQARHVARVLVVDEIAGEPMGADFLDTLVSRMTGSGLEAIRVAFVELVSAHVPMMEHGQILAMEQGFQARVFSRMDDADRWLRFGAA